MEGPLCKLILRALVARWYANVLQLNTRLEVELDHGRSGARSRAGCSPSELKAQELRSTYSRRSPRYSIVLRVELRVIARHAFAVMVLFITGCREVEHASFTPLVMSATGGLAKEATTFYKRLASMLSHKWDHSYSSTLRWLRCRLNFSLLRSSIQALRGSRSSIGHPVKAPVVIDLVNIESRILSDSTA